MRKNLYLATLLMMALLTYQCGNNAEPLISIEKNNHIVLIGNNLGSRMLNYGHFETELQMHFPDSALFIRNMCDGGNTPSFRPHSGRVSPWAFEGAEQFHTELANKSGSRGHFETPDEWLTRLEADVILAFFGYGESFEGEAGLENYKAELKAFVQHTLAQKYNGKAAAQLVLVSPIAYQDLSSKFDLPDGKQENINLELYTKAMEEVALAANIPFLNAFAPSKKWFSGNKDLTVDGFQLSDKGYQKFSKWLVSSVFGGTAKAKGKREAVKEAVLDKNWLWHNDFKMPNGVHVFGRRYEPFGSDNYPAEIKKIREMTANRDQAIWATLKGETFDLKAADEKTTPLVEIETNYDPTRKNGNPEYLYGDSAISKLTVPEGYKIELFASEKDFPDLANPVQLSFDNQGRLWVATMPSYPHYAPGSKRPDDKLLILEDTDGDGKADKQTVFADKLHLPVGFEFSPEGVYVSQGTNLILLTDTDGDDKADKREIILSGFDDHDTHHVISAFCADPSGAIYMAEGVFLHTNVETPYGVVRGTNGGFYRYNPQRKHLERTAQLSIPNPWGIAFDEWGQNFFAETSGPDVLWMMPGSVESTYGIATHKSYNLIEGAHRVRPTSGLEFVSSRHFPDSVQGDLLINNTIGFLGTKQHRWNDDGTGYVSTHRQDLIKGDDRNFRPVDMEFAPDGSLYLVDWHNVLIGHMQHNARDPLRDHVHGRIYRMTCVNRPLVEPAKVIDASISELLDNLKLPEYRTRYRTRRELRARNANKVAKTLKSWAADLDKNDARYEHHLLEGLWVSWGLNKIDASLMEQALKAKDFRVRAAAVRVLRYTGHQLENSGVLFKQAANDEHGRVRLEAIVAASWLSKADGIAILNEASKYDLDKWMVNAYNASLNRLNGNVIKNIRDKTEVTVDLKGKDLEAYVKGKVIFSRDGFCATCHQADGKGLPAAGFPPLAQTDWVNGNEERLIKLTLNGLMGPIEVNGVKYPGNVPMTPFGRMLNDEQIAAVLTYVRKSFGNDASVISEEKVKEVREATKENTGFYQPSELQ